MLPAEIESGSVKLPFVEAGSDKQCYHLGITGKRAVFLSGFYND
jgi:hypothetical protein